MPREESPRRGSGIIQSSNNEPVFSRPNADAERQQLDSHVAEVVREWNTTMPGSKIRIMPYNGVVNTQFHSVQLSADVINDLELLGKLFNTASWTASLRYETRNQGVNQLWVDFARVTPIKKKQTKSKFWEIMIFLGILMLIFSGSFVFYRGANGSIKIN